MHLKINKFSFFAAVLGLFAGTPVIAQTSNGLATAVHQEQLNHPAEQYRLFELSGTRNAQIDQEINNVVYLKLNTAALALLRTAQAPLITFSLPGGQGSAHTFTLNSYNILDEGFKVYTRGSNGKKTEVNVETAAFYRGILNGLDNSVAAFTFHKDEIAAVFSTPEQGNYNLVLNYLNPGVNNENYLLFREADVKEARQYKCGVTDDMDKLVRDADVSGAKGTYNSCHKLKVSMHADYELFLKKNNSVTGCVTYLTSLLNVISALYNNEGINMVMSEAVVNNAPDNYTYGGSDEVLLKFGDDMHNGINGDIAQMVSGYSEWGYPPLGGLAWRDVLCMTPTQYPDGSGGTVWVGPFSMSNNDIIDNLPQLPVYSWDVNASAHEMGHNIGSPHTQSCSWAGGPIDNCYPVEEGPCSPGPNPAASGGDRKSVV